MIINQITFTFMVVDFIIKVLIEIVDQAILSRNKLSQFHFNFLVGKFCRNALLLPRTLWEM